MAFTNRQELVDRVESVLANERSGSDKVSRAIIQDEADATVVWLSRYVPRHVSATISGDGSAYQFALSSFTVPWVVGFSTLDWVEYETGEQERRFVPLDVVELFPSIDTATHLHFSDTTPASASGNIRVSYTALHSVTDATSTVPDHLEPGFEYGLVCSVSLAMAARMAHTTSAAIEADSVNYRSKEQEWRSIATAYCDKASAVLGVSLDPPSSGGSGGGASSGSSKPAGRWADVDPVASGWGGPLFRSRRSR